MVALSKQAGEQRYKGKANEGNAAARHKLFHALAFCTWVVVAVALHEVNAAPNAKTCAKRDYQSLQYVTALLKKSIENSLSAAKTAQKMLLEIKMPRFVGANFVSIVSA